MVGTLSLFERLHEFVSFLSLLIKNFILPTFRLDVSIPSVLHY